MKKNNFLFIQYLLLTTTILVGYTHCRCTPPSPQDTSPSSSPADSNNNPVPPTTINQEMIDIVADTVKIDPTFQFLLDRLQEFKNGDKTNIDKQDTNYYDSTALHYAAMLGNPSIVAALLKMGADPNMTDNVEQSPFITNLLYNLNKVLETAEIFLNDPKVTSFINLKDASSESPLTHIESRLQLFDLSKVTDYPEIKDFLIIREKMISHGATH